MNKDIPEDARPDKAHAIFEYEDAVPELPERRVMRVVLDPNREASKQFIQLLESGVELGLSFLLNVAGSGCVLSKNEELAKALQARQWERFEKGKL